MSKGSMREGHDHQITIILPPNDHGGKIEQSNLTLTKEILNSLAEFFLL